MHASTLAGPPGSAATRERTAVQRDPPPPAQAPPASAVLAPSVPSVLQVIVHDAAQSRHELIHFTARHVTGNLDHDLDTQLLFLARLWLRHAPPSLASRNGILSPPWAAGPLRPLPGKFLQPHRSSP